VENPVLRLFKEGRIKNFSTALDYSRFVLQPTLGTSSLALLGISEEIKPEEEPH